METETQYIVSAYEKHYSSDDWMYTEAEKGDALQRAANEAAIYNKTYYVHEVKSTPIFKAEIKTEVVTQYLDGTGSTDQSN